MTSIRRLAALVVLATLAAGCASPGPRLAPTQPPPSGPEGRLTRIETVSLSPDHRVVTITFVGGRPLPSGDPCFTDYRATAMPTGDRLAVAVIQLPTRSGSQPCAAVGYLRSLSANLDAPFDGTTVVDRAGYVHFLSPPMGLLNLGGLPAGWDLRAQGDVEESPTGRWRRLYSRVTNPGPNDSQLELYQSFGSPVDISGGPERTNVSIRGNAGILWHDPTYGEWLVTWMVGADGLGVVAHERDFSKAQILALAESVR